MYATCICCGHVWHATRPTKIVDALLFAFISVSGWQKTWIPSTGVELNGWQRHNMMLYRVLKCDVIKFSFFAFQHFHVHISVEHDEKPSHTKFDVNWFMVAQDLVAWIPSQWKLDWFITLFGTRPIYTDFNGANYVFMRPYLRGAHELIPTKFELWMFFIMLHQYMVSKTLECIVMSSLLHSIGGLGPPF